MTVVFEILSPSNSFEEGIDKIAFYEEHGAEELYFYNPDKNRLEVYLRQGEILRRQRPGHGFVSPRLGVRFDLSGPEMVVFRPDGRPFLTLAEVEASAAPPRSRPAWNASSVWLPSSVRSRPSSGLGKRSSGQRGWRNWAARHAEAKPAPTN